MKQWIKDSLSNEGPSIKRQIAVFFAIVLVVGIFVKIDIKYVYVLASLIGTLVVGNVVDKFSPKE